MNYRLAYRIGFHPWEDLAEHPPFARALLDLVAQDENGGAPPHGAALDLGCGSAVWGVRLARRGWQVTGVDLVERALERARDRVAAAGVELRLVHGDVTALREAGRRHGLPARARHRHLPRAHRHPSARRWAARSTRRAPPTPRSSSTASPPAGAGRCRAARTAPTSSARSRGWTITDVVRADAEPDALARAFGFDEHFYRLRRAVAG